MERGNFSVSLAVKDIEASKLFYENGDHKRPKAVEITNVNHDDSSVGCSASFGKQPSAPFRTQIEFLCNFTRFPLIGLPAYEVNTFALSKPSPLSHPFGNADC